MGQKQKQKGLNQKKKPGPNSVPHKDHYCRMSYLFQASNYFAMKPQYDVLARSMAKNVVMVSQKTVLKLSPEVKRSICKKCYNFMIPGLSMGMAIENKSKTGDEKNDVLVHTCSVCQKEKRFPVGANREYLLFCEREDVVHNVE